MNAITGRVALLLFGSGMCALVYEIAWLREFRLFFGASTSANAAVLAVFIGGLGAGGLVLGRKADRAPRPIALYAVLEAAIAILSALTPLLLSVARKVYIGLGGAASLGATGATVLRLVLTMIVLLGPTFLMGGTLPAAARGVESETDASRRGVGLLYGCNTLGAVTGCVVANFFLLEGVGTRKTLWLASAVNLLVAVLAYVVDRTAPAEAREIVAPAPDRSSEGEETAAVPGPAAAVAATSRPAQLTVAFVLAASAIVGFVFFLMELVWYRMLAPILGGSVFMFGIILAVALLGIGMGAIAFAALASKRVVTVGTFALSCLLEAALVGFPYALGDRVAIFTLLLRPLGSMGFGGVVLQWSLVTMVVVFPAALVAGAQFPLLIALLGRGKDRVGVETGLAYAANTGGAIMGALMGGFGLLSALSVPGCWQLSVGLLAALGLAAGLSLLRRPRSYFVPIVSVVAVVAIAIMLGADGPTAVWRHSAIAVGRIPSQATPSPNTQRAWMNTERRAIRWEKDGVESTVALNARTGWSFIVNGKSDGHARTDAPTQVMLGLVGAVLRPQVRRAMVIGLGTGSTAGWLGAIDGIERVDVAELEPAVLHVAAEAGPVNRDVLHNPRVVITIGDAREILLTSREKYDLIASEPSNPYRAGVASLFTQEYYLAVRSRLADDGVFLQWVQAYSVDNRTLRSVSATIAAVFPEVETWDLRAHDLLLMASKKPLRYDVAQIRDQLNREPFRSGLLYSWRTTGVEGFLSHFIARSSFARAIAFVDRAALNTDDRNLIEFGFARDASGDTQGGRINEIREVARSRGEHRPLDVENEVDWQRVEDERLAFRAVELTEIPIDPSMGEDRYRRAMAFAHFAEGRLQDVVGAWRSQPREPSGPTELALLAQSLAEVGDEAAMGYLDRLRTFQPIEADAILARLRLRQGKIDEAASLLASAFERYRSDPWPWPIIMEHALRTAREAGGRRPDAAGVLRAALAPSFVVRMLDEARNDTVLSFAMSRGPDQSCADALQPLEPYVPWQHPMLAWRARCYSMLNHPEAVRAASELSRFVLDQPPPFGNGLNFVRVGP